MKQLMLRQYVPDWGERERRMVQQVLEGDYLSESKYAMLFEGGFANLVNAKYCVIVPSGGIALYLALRTVMAPQPQVYHIPAYAGVFLANACEQLGYGVKLRDVSLKDACARSGKFPLMTVHPNGRYSEPAVIEDCCQYITHHTPGSISCYSFHASKHLTLGGMGGAVCCDDKDIYDRLTAMKDYGRTPASKKKDVDYYPEWGTNYKVPEVNAAFGLVQLNRLEKKLQRLREITRIYRECLPEAEFLEGEPQWYPDMLVRDAESFQFRMCEAGVEVRRFYKPLTYRYPDHIPNAEILYKCGVYLPCSYNLTDGEIQTICDIIKKE